VSGSDYRPGYHFTPHRNWMNDPNGLVFHKGRYHLFFQYNPEGDRWANMSWGHASSPDLVHWQEHPVAIPRTDTEEIFSGSVVVDHENTAGFAAGTDPPLVAVYTSVYRDGKQAQSLAFSTDDGATWMKYPANPVLDRSSTSFRDPKVFWYSEPGGSGYWVLVAVEAAARQVVFYRSANLKVWTHLSVFGAHPTDTPATGGQQFWECPDLFPLPVDGDPTHSTWVLLISVNPDPDTGGSATCYILGHFDGASFTPIPDATLLRLDWGADLYAAGSFDNAPDRRRIIIGWMSNWTYAADVPTSPWRGTMSSPRELALRTVAGKQTLVQQPPVELRVLDHMPGRTRSAPFTVDGTREFVGGRQYRVDVTFEPVNAPHFGLDLLVGDGWVTRLRYDLSRELLTLDRSTSGQTAFHPSFASVDSAPITLTGGRLRLQVFVDRTSVEVFAQGGAGCLTDQVFPGPAATRFRVGSFGGATRIRSLECVPLHTAASPHP